MSSTHTVALAVRRALMFGAISTAVVAPLAHAQDTAGATELETIVVTGSRIKQANLESSSPVTQVTAADIEAQGVTRIEDLINHQATLIIIISNESHTLFKISVMKTKVIKLFSKFKRIQTDQGRYLLILAFQKRCRAIVDLF